MMEVARASAIQCLYHRRYQSSETNPFQIVNWPVHAGVEADTESPRDLAN